MNPNANKRVQMLRRQVAFRIANYRALLLAFSGGLDSTVLLDIFATLRNGDRVLKLRAVHINHALSCHADKWAVHCEKECLRRSIPFTMVNVVIDETSESIEAAARSVRYRALVGALKQDEVLLTAQHQDDQAETLLLALKRGSGPAGLSAMAADALYLGHRLVRPLLDVSRSEIEQYAQVCGLHWIEDESNTELRFDRNFLRLCILPLLRQRWPQFANAVARSAQICAEQEQLLDELLKETLADVIAPDGSLCLTVLATMSEDKRAALLRRWLASLGVKMPPRAQLVRMWKEVALSRRDSKAHLKLNDRFVRRFRDRLYVVPHFPPLKNDNTVFPWSRESECLSLPAGLGNLYRRQLHVDRAVSVEPFVAVFKKSSGVEEWQDNGNRSAVVDADNIANVDTNTGMMVLPLTVVRAPLSGERVSVRFGSVHGLLHIEGRCRGRTLKKIWQEMAIPSWWRNRTPLLFYNDQLIAALGVFVTKEGAARNHNAQWHIFFNRTVC